MARILYYGAPKDAPETAFVHQKGSKVQEVPLPRNNFSESFELGAGALRLAFFPSESLEEIENPEAAPFLDIPEGWGKVLILVFEDPDNTLLPIRLKAINANDNQFGPGDLYFVNFSKRTIFGMVGDEKMNLKPEGTTIVSSPRKARGDYNVQLDSVKGEEKGSRRWLLRQTWRHQPSVRRVVFAIPLPAPRNIKLYSAPIRNF